jgi:hypothetical protein
MAENGVVAGSAQKAWPWRYHREMAAIGVMSANRRNEMKIVAKK